VCVTSAANYSMASRLSNVYASTWPALDLKRDGEGEAGGMAGSGEELGPIPVGPARDNRSRADGGVGAVMFMLSAIMIEGLMWGKCFFSFL
jgi:hypothetical protein